MGSKIVNDCVTSFIDDPLLEFVYCPNINLNIEESIWMTKFYNSNNNNKT